MKNPPRKFEIIHGDGPRVTRDQVTAAYWTDRPSVQDDEYGPFVLFKDSDGKPVLAVRIDQVIAIREIRDVPVVELDWDELRVASTALIEFGRTASEALDSDTETFREKAEAIGWKLHGADRIVTISEDPLADIVDQFQRGLLSIDEARTELGKLPWGLPETEDRRPWDAK